MKRIFTIFAICAALLAMVGCPNDSTSNSDAPSDSTLKIKNESFTEITDVIWQNVSFANNSVENSIKTGTTVTKDVGEGTGYIFFKRKTNPIVARTKDLVSVEKKAKPEFVFTDNTLIVEVNNPNNTGKLGDLTSTVVFFDDAEGEIQQYVLRQRVAEYYGNGFDDSYRIASVKNGKRSIAVGKTGTAKLHLQINLVRSAKLSFWYAYRNYSSSRQATFSINNQVQGGPWKKDIDWSFLTFNLSAGTNDLVWENTDIYYLSLDDILIYYNE